MNDCPYCSAANAPSRHYCRSCGRQIVTFCDHCGFANEIEVHYCGGCGQPIAIADEAQVTSAETDASPVTSASTGTLSANDLSRLKKINEHRRQTIAIAGSRKRLSQKDLDRLFGKETK